MKVERQMRETIIRTERYPAAIIGLELSGWRDGDMESDPRCKFYAPAVDAERHSATAAARNRRCVVALVR